MVGRSHGREIQIDEEVSVDTFGIPTAGMEIRCGFESDFSGCECTIYRVRSTVLENGFRDIRTLRVLVVLEPHSIEVL